jgi:hypothetical protein
VTTSGPASTVPVAQCPLEHEAKAVHTVPHAPQLSGSICVWAQ